MTNSTSTTNPNSNLYFDFPDPTPRFEFDDSPARSTSSSFASKRVRVGGGGGGVVQQRIKLFGGRFATKRNGRKGSSSVGHNANGGSSSPGGLSCGDFSTTENTTTTSTTACSTPSTTPGSSSSGRSLTSRGSGGGGRRTNSESQSLFELDDAPLRIPLHASGGSGGGHRKAAMSYVSAGSESEFSFDRVTVTTNETGNFSNSKMSSIDWGFIDGQSGGSSSGGGGGANNNNNDDDGIVNGQQQQQQHQQQQQQQQQQHAPSLVIAAGMDAAACAARGRTVVPPPVIERKSPITRLSPSSSSSSQAIQQNHKLSIHRLSPTIMGQDHLRRSSSPPPRGRGHRLHLPHDYDIDSSSLPGSDVPVLMKSVNKSNNVDDQSVISEISERTGAFFMDDDDNYDNANDAVRALLYGEGGKIEEEEMSPKSTTTATVRYKMNSGFGGGGGGGGGGDTSSPAASTKGQTIETPSYINRQHQRLRTTKSNNCCKNDNTPFFLLASSSPMTTIKALVEDIQTKYDTYMAAHSSSQQEEKQGQEQHQGCSIQSIIEDLQFCGWYLCGMIDTTTISSPKQQQQKDATLEKTMLDAKEVRKKEAELTFLGKDIAVCGANSTTGIATNIGGGGRGNWCTQL